MFCEAPQSSNETSSTGILSLPPDVLGTIFEEYVHGMDPEPPSTPPTFPPNKRLLTRKDASTSPFTLGWICGLWRTVSISTPSLWSGIYITNPRNLDIPAFDLWLSRSSTHLLDVSLLIFAGNSTAFKGQRRSVNIYFLERLLEHAHRWRSIRLSLASKFGDVLTDFTSSRKVTAPNLVSFSLSIYGWSEDSMSQVSQILASSTRLRTGTWGKFSREYGSGIHWAGLTSLEFIIINYSDVHFVLQRTPNLQALELGSIGGKEQGSQARLLTLPHLRTISVIQGIALDMVLGYLTLPSLSSVTITSYSTLDEPQEGWAPIVRLIQRSGCKLHRFSCENYPPQFDLVSELVELSSVANSTLEDLALFGGVENTVLEVLSQASTLNPLKQNLFPNLRSVDLRWCTVDVEGVEALIRTRPGLRKVRLRPSNRMGASEKGCRVETVTGSEEPLIARVVIEKGPAE